MENLVKLSIVHSPFSIFHSPFSTKKMTYLICYDISDNNLRTRLAKRLDRAGCLRLQKSVFIAPDFDARRLKILRGGIAKILPPTLALEESLIVFPIEKDNLTHPIWAGNSSKIEKILEKALFKIL